MNSINKEDSTSDTARGTVISPTHRIIVLRSRDGDAYEIQTSAASLSQLIKTTIECGDDDDDDNDNDNTIIIEPIDLPKVGSSCLKKVVEFCSHHAEEPMIPINSPLTDDTLETNVSQEWYQNFITGIDQNMIFELVTAANYMEIPPLLDLTCLIVSIGFMGKQAEEIREILKIAKMTPDEEAKARKEHRWIFED